MRLHAGFQTYEFRFGMGSTLDDDDTLYFDTHEDALRWLKHLGWLHASALPQLRSYVARHFDDPETYRVTNHYSLERLANLLYLRRVVVNNFEERASAGAPEAANEALPPAFPLAERTKIDASTSSRPALVVEGATFDPNSDAAAQAATLVAAAADGKPFCAECTKS
jgi:hypothetical protein